MIPTLDAVGWSFKGNVDVRPRLVDKSTGQSRLIDSGAQITATVRGPEDKPDHSFTLVAVNGSNIPTYGIREITVKIGRKPYKIPAVICDIKEDILGMDFIHKYKLGFEWDDYTQSELFIVDKRAQIKAPLQIVTVPVDLQRTHHMVPAPDDATSNPWSGEAPKPQVSAQTVAFEVACMKALGEPEKEEQIEDIEQKLRQHPEEYVKLIKSHPKLLNPTFSKGPPIHNVYHKIETGNHPPCRTKRRPLIANAEKAEKGRKAWQKMERDGVIERVKPGDNTDWTSALHLADKPGGGVRPCSDFRLLNLKTILDAYELPMLKDFTGKISGSRFFSKVDLRSAFFNVPIWPQHKHKTTTLDPWGGVYVYNRLPFGLCSGPASWQKLLDTILQDIPNIFNYMDELLVYGDTNKAHDKT